jgi:glutathione synthase/RimK-type ligase-like ATP-grasp enzyme
MRRLGTTRTTLLIDAVNLTAVRYALTPSGDFSVEVDGRRVNLTPSRPVPGWIRRIAPAEWQRGVVVESEEAAIKSACLSVIAALARASAVEWLSSLDACVAAENKVLQYSAASRLGAQVPRTIITSDPAELGELPDAVVVKPLGPGHYYARDEPMVVFATAMTRDQAARLPLQTAPFLIQERLMAVRHHRIVTVMDGAWTSAVDAAEIPVDWRSDPDAHRRFAASTVPSTVTEHAIHLARHLHLGYSSQDWIETTEGFVFLDLNPGGQWLFLHEQQADAVTAAIAAHLAGSAS